jgi:cyclophilin family peptidyl-prolyl cis-trans isomerase
MLMRGRLALVVIGLVALPIGAISANPAPPNPLVEITVAGRGAVRVELFQKEAPKTVAHFLGLVKSKFYDGILFHRVRPHFVAQAGDPETKKLKPADVAGKSDADLEAAKIGGGGSGKNIPFEENRYTHEPATLAMALNAPHSATGDSQFFINLVPNHRLDGDYCVFGKVTKGFEVVKKIRQGDRIMSMKVITK